ncbi:lysophospholipid transporter LplT [Paenibacillus sp. S-38]|uniref:lysophospholipid transporter LplT n=1 Tax=Paenibacillus sp. S-38 TaxID=3416710 RepID=UPI003CEECF7F
MNRIPSSASRSLRSLYVSQFLSAFADNAVFFVILGVLSARGSANPEEGMLGVQLGFLLAYVVLAPFVGTFADKNRKSRVLLIGNLLKTGGTLLLFTPFPPAAAYALVGVGAVVFSPAKYGVLTDITGDDKAQLYRANGNLESYTILAILLGTVAGGWLASFAPALGIAVCVLLYLASSVLTPLISCREGNPELHYGASAGSFFREVRILFAEPKARFSLVGTSAFWMTSSVLRITFLIWIAQYLGVQNQLLQSGIIGATGVGIVIGALLTPRLVRIEKFYRAYLFGFLMLAAILLALLPVHLVLTVILLLLIGTLGGLFIIPMNTVLQDQGKDLVGSGKTIAIQNFSENLFMIGGVGLAKLLIAGGLNVSLTTAGIALLFGALVWYLKGMVPRLKQAV